VLPAGYQLRVGTGLDRALLLKFLQRTYAERFPGGTFAHLADTVEHYFSRDTPLWWVEMANPSMGMPSSRSEPFGCLWLGNAIDQSTGDRNAHIFLLYVVPEHRRKGIGSALVRYAEEWAKQRGDRQIGLQVFESNTSAIKLYEALGYQTQSLWMMKTLE
jgi:ribosomal protein S18 acetylase RimI-like enzyme